MVVKPKKLILIDSLGALLSAFLLGVILVRFESSFGMPRKILYFLAMTASAMAIYSFVSYLVIKENRKPYLKIIACTNLVYCCITAGLPMYFCKELTHLGLLYFLSEITIIITLAIIELKSASKHFHEPT